MADAIILATILMCLISMTNARDFYVNWVENPKESYNHWAERMRFQVNDKLVFTYKEGEDSVLVVKKEGYDTCNGTNPILRMDRVVSTFQFNRSGPFYFISGVSDRCVKGQKLIVVVLAERNKKPISPPATTACPPPPPPPLSLSPTQAPSSNRGGGSPTKSSSSDLNVSRGTMLMVALVLSHIILG